MLKGKRMIKALPRITARFRLVLFVVATLIVFVAVAGNFTHSGNFIETSNFRVEAAAGINRTINFQGKVVANSTGINITNGNYNVEFKLYDAASGGTTLWTETRTGGNQVAVTDGIFRVALGSVTTIPTSIDFNSDSLYLGINFNGDGEMSPRVRFTSVPYAFNAEKVAGLTVANTTGSLTIPNASDIVFSGANDITFTSTGATTVTLPTTGTLATLAGVETFTNKSIGSTGLIFTGATTDITTGTNEHFAIMPNGVGNVGIGTTSPASLLSVYHGNDGSGGVIEAKDGGAIFMAQNGSYPLQLGNNTSGANSVRFRIGSNGIIEAASQSYGSASSPAYSFMDDNNTGIFNPTTDSIGFSTNGTEQMRLDSAGNLGIGTTSTRAKLDVAGGASLSGTLAFRGTTDPKIDFLNGENFGIRSSVGGDTGLIERLTVLNNGRVGIGTTSPEHGLDIVNDSGHNALFIKGTGGYPNSFIFNTGDYQNALGFSGNTLEIRKINPSTGAYASGDPIISMFSYTASTAGYGELGLGSLAGTAKIRGYGSGDLALQPTAGNVGIGDTTPSYNLDVSGTGRFTGAVDLDGDLELNSTLTDINGSVGTSGQILSSTGTGVDWIDPGSASVADNSLDFIKFEPTMDLDTNLILNQGSYTWTQNFTGTTTTGLSYVANSLTSGTALSASSNSLSTGSLVNLTSTSTAANSNSQKLLNLSTSGANTNASQTTYGIYSTNSHSGTGSINVAGYFESNTGAANWGIRSSATGSTFATAGHFLASDTTQNQGILVDATKTTNTTAGITYGAIIGANATSALTTGTEGVTGIYASAGRSNHTGGTVDIRGIHINFGTISNGGTTNLYGLYINNATGGDTNYAIYSEGGDSYFGGNLGIGTTTISEKIHVNGNIRADGNFIGNSLDRATAGALTVGNATATSISLCNSANCDTIQIGTNTDADAISIGDTLDGLTIASSAFNVNTTGAVSGVSTLASTGDWTWTATTPTITINNAETFSVTGSGGTDVFTVNTSGSSMSFTDGTNGFTFDADTGPLYTGTARPVSKLTVSPEYSGGTLSLFYGAGTESSHTGTMTADVETTGTNDLRTFYDWSSAETSLNSYVVAVRVTLPTNFGGWATTNALQINFTTESTSNANNSLDTHVYLSSNSTTALSSTTNNVAAVAGTWQTVNIDDSAIDDGSAPEWDDAGETAVIYLRMRSKDNNSVKLGDIVLNYFAKF